jgi:hypothetical protein
MEACGVLSGRGVEVPEVAEIFSPVQKVHRTTESETFDIYRT